MADAGRPQAEGFDKAKLKQFLVPALAVAAVLVLVGLVVFFSGGSSRKMSDGSDGSADDPGLREVAPGVKVRDLKEGMGDEVAPGSKVTVHYTGWLANGTEFDSSKKRGEPIAFSLAGGPTGVIAGWVEGIPGMKKNGVRKLVIAPDKGYGKEGRPPKIPADSTLIFEVELVDFGPGPVDARPRRSPAPTDLTKLSDGSAPGAEDKALKPLGAGGLMYRDVKPGDGPACPPGAHVIMDYTGWLTSGGQPFDSSWKADSDGPLDMSLDRLVKGWQKGVPGMKVGGIRKLVIPAELAYGSDGRPGIPPNATLVFEIELLGLR